MNQAALVPPSAATEASAPPLVTMEGLSKSFGSFAAVKNINLSILRGEIFSLLGGSGCGKTTLLRMLAGFEEPTSGRIFIDGQDITGLPAYMRPIHMMFQNYALFPHMTVEKNIGYGLKHENMSATQRRERIREMVSLVQLGGLEGRKPHQISGGQRQRVALARALARRPKLLLLDEPLAALDKKLREHTQFELMNVQAQTGVTFIVVTHDQEEAMTLSSRIAVMDRGEIRQIGTSTDIYEYPNSRFVAGFIGSITFFEGIVEAIAGDIAAIALPELGITAQVRAASGLSAGQPVTLALRPEKVAITRLPPQGPNVVQGKVKDIAYFGKDSLYRVTLASGALIAVHAVNMRRVEESKRVADWGDEIWLSFDPDAAILLAE